jgi:hypothetical protein
MKYRFHREALAEYEAEIRYYNRQAAMRSHPAEGSATSSRG